MSEEKCQDPQEEIIEVILEEGDCLEDLAFTFGTTVADIKKENPEQDVEQPRPEQPVRIPVPGRRCPSGNIYIARRGDTLAGIARRFGVTEAAILRENPFLFVLGVRAGFPICIPAPQPIRCPGGFVYTVVAGDTLFSIAARFNTTVGAVIQANPGLEPGRLLTGQQICIPLPQPARCTGGFFYTVVAGDTVAGIAARFNTTAGDILRANPGLDPNRLIVGQQICIPVAPQPACPGFFYIVVAGDTINGIAARFNTTVPAILQANPGLNPDFIVIGQRICIPAAPPQPCPGFMYTVVAGDTLFAIANRFNTTVDAILRANPGLDPNRLFIGQQICIPR